MQVLDSKEERAALMLPLRGAMSGCLPPVVKTAG